MVIGPGLTLGAVFALFYGLVLAFSVEDDRLRFVAPGGGFGILLFPAYWKLSRGRSSTNAPGEDLE